MAVDVAEHLAGNRWFAALPAALRSAVTAAASPRTLAAGQWVYGQGDEDTGVVMVLDGMLRLETMVGDRLVLIGVARAGAAFGQSRRHGGGPRIVTARAGPPSRVATVGDSALGRIAVEQPAIWHAVSTLVYAQLDASVHGLAEMLALPPVARIAARLRPFAESGVAPLSQADLAELCGLSRKTTNAHLATLEAAGAIARGYGCIRLIDAAVLASFGAADADRAQGRY